MNLGSNGLHDLTSQNRTHIITVAQIRVEFSKFTAKSKVALNRLAALVNLPQAEDLTPVEKQKLLAYKITDANILAVHRNINNTHISGLVDTHFNATLPSTTADKTSRAKAFYPHR